MELKNRIKKVRQDAGLTQEDFAKKLGTVQNTITGYETGRRSPSGSALALICREFNVNETWLRTGQGDMYCDSDDDFRSVMEEIGVQDHRARDIILSYWHMSPSEKETFWNILDKLAKN